MRGNATKLRPGICRRAQRVAVVALARKLSGILYAMWRDGSAYDPAKLGGAQVRKSTKAA